MTANPTTPVIPTAKKASKGTLSAKQRYQVALDAVLKDINRVAAGATPADVTIYHSIAAAAKSPEPSVTIYKDVTPAVFALLFLHHNKRNRHLKFAWVRELRRRIEAGQWAWVGDTFSFFDDGVLSDGQNRMAAMVLAEYTLPVAAFAFGVTEPFGKDETAVRQAFEHAEFHGVEEAKVKQAIVLVAAKYLSGVETLDDVKMRSNVEIGGALALHDVVLTAALAITDAARKDVNGAKLPRLRAAVIAYLLLDSDWPADKVRHVLNVLLSGSDPVGGNESPLFVASGVVLKGRGTDKNTGKPIPLPYAQEIGLVIKAAIKTEEGVTRWRHPAKNTREEAAKTDPAYPGVEPQGFDLAAD